MAELGWAYDEQPQSADFPVDREWWRNPPNTLEAAAEILKQRAIYINSFNEEGIELRKLLEWTEQEFKKIEGEVQSEYPIAFVRPSFEQSLILNAWWCGVDFPITFSANRIGKTAGYVFNGILWVIPNNPEWLMFTPYIDEFGKEVHVLQRPPLSKIATLQNFLSIHPEYTGDPYKPYDDSPSGNRVKFEFLRRVLGECFQPAWPAPPIQEGGTIWLGAPDNAYHREIILPEWKKWLPKPQISHWSESNDALGFQINTLETGNPHPTTIEFICKSYESKDTKWSGAAVLGIVMTEGVEPTTLDEIKQRIKEGGFASWDYTPYEAANVGKKTALAQRVYEKKEPLPLHPFIFVGFGAKDAPTHILPQSKKNDLIRMWEGKEQGKARLYGFFFSSSPLILSKLDRPFHTLPWTKEELFQRFPSHNLYRGIDPGYDHPTACSWGLLTPQNLWFIYRFYSESGKTIGERCKDIITLSGNRQFKRYYGKRPTDFNLVECHQGFPNAGGEVYNGTIADYHTFKADETTGVPLSTRYLNEGLPIMASVTMAPKDRALEINKFLDKVDFYTHPVLGTTPSSRLFFLINEPGVDAALGKMEEIYWDRLKSGDRKGQPKDEVQKDDDDELDATCYLVCSGFPYTRWRPEPTSPPPNPYEDEQDLKIATLQIQGDLQEASSQQTGFGGDYIEYYVQ